MAAKYSSTKKVDSWDDPGRNATFCRNSEEFDEYYKMQRIVMSDEWESFAASLQLDLPVTFRVISGTTFTAFLVDFVESHFSLFDQKLFRLKWYPGYAYQLDMGRYQLRSSEQFTKFYRFLVDQTEAGTIIRQELVSMIPALFIPQKKGDYILDLCAAPGSKTSQFLENGLQLNNECAVVANDLCPRRGHMLIHRLRHLDSSHLLVTTHPAEKYPDTFLESGGVLKFDGILCDVVCSGDGTLRKAKNLWKAWPTLQKNSLTLHKTQLQILKRAAELCKVGGTFVYSTCSLNPIENEAVIDAFMATHHYCASIVDVKNEMPELHRSCGLETWSVMWENKMYSRYDELSDVLQKQVPQSVFPQNTARFADLSRCLRFYPHQNNSGGFFITVFLKTAACDEVVKKIHKRQQRDFLPLRCVDNVGTVWKATGGAFGFDDDKTLVLPLFVKYESRNDPKRVIFLHNSLDLDNIIPGSNVARK